MSKCKYKKAADVPVNDKGLAVFTRSEASVIDWWKARKGKYYLLCHFFADDNGQDKRYSVDSNKLLKVRSILRGKFRNWDDTFVHCDAIDLWHQFSFDTHNISYDDDYLCDQVVLWPLTAREVVDFKSRAKHMAAKKVDEF